MKRKLKKWLSKKLSKYLTRLVLDALHSASKDMALDSQNPEKIKLANLINAYKPELFKRTMEKLNAE